MTKVPCGRKNFFLLRQKNHQRRRFSFVLAENQKKVKNKRRKRVKTKFRLLLEEDML